MGNEPFLGIPLKRLKESIGCKDVGGFFAILFLIPRESGSPGCRLTRLTHENCGRELRSAPKRPISSNPVDRRKRRSAPQLARSGLCPQSPLPSITLVPSPQQPHSRGRPYLLGYICAPEWSGCPGPNGHPPFPGPEIVGFRIRSQPAEREAVFSPSFLLFVGGRIHKARCVLMASVFSSFAVFQCTLLTVAVTADQKDNHPAAHLWRTQFGRAFLFEDVELELIRNCNEMLQRDMAKYGEMVQHWSGVWSRKW